LLPDGYHLERDSDVITLRRAGGSVVACFSARGVDWSEVERAVEADAGRTLHRGLRRVADHRRRKHA
jgi:hypothetical protein